MTISIGSDHAGFCLKQDVIKYLQGKNINVLDKAGNGTSETNHHQVIGLGRTRCVRKRKQLYRVSAAIARRATAYNLVRAIQNVDIHIRRLRAKMPPLSADLLETRRGIGYGLRL